MATFYKIILAGIARNQIINNMFYAARNDGTDVEQSQQAYEEVANAFEAQILPSFLAAVADDYVAESLQVSVVDETNKQQSLIGFERDVVGTGSNASSADGVGRVAIVAFKCLPITDTQTYRVPKRSYIAIGPLSTYDIDDDGALTTTFRSGLGQAFADAANNFSAVVGAQAWTVRAARVGVLSEKTNNGSAGFITTATVRPNASFRRSRVPRPSGG